LQNFLQNLPLVLCTTTRENIREKRQRKVQGGEMTKEAQKKERFEEGSGPEVLKLESLKKPRDKVYHHLL
jgi:hypothetical protein